MLLIYFGATWFEFGRDPRRGTIVPLFAPPDGLSPAAVRYIHRMAYDRKAYAASLIDMAVKGYLTISMADDTYTLTRTGKSEADCDLAHGEAAIAGKLFDGPNDSIEMQQDNHSEIAASITALKSSLKTEYERNYFVTNQFWFWGGLAILAITTGATALLSEDFGISFGLLFWLSGWSFGTFFIVHRAYDAWLSVIAGPGSRILNAFGALFTTAFALPFVGGWCVGAWFASQGMSPIADGLLMAGGIAAYVFYHLLKAPTLAGAKIIDQLDGFRLFLNTAEKNRLEVTQSAGRHARFVREIHCPMPWRWIARTAGAENSKPRSVPRRTDHQRHRRLYPDLVFRRRLRQFRCRRFRGRPRRVARRLGRVGLNRARLQLRQRRRGILGRRRGRRWRRGLVGETCPCCHGWRLPPLALSAVVDREFARAHADQQQQSARDGDVAREDLVLRGVLHRIVERPIGIHQHGGDHREGEQQHRAVACLESDQQRQPAHHHHQYRGGQQRRGEGDMTHAHQGERRVPVMHPHPGAVQEEPRQRQPPHQGRNQFRKRHRFPRTRSTDAMLTEGRPKIYKTGNGNHVGPVSPRRTAFRGRSFKQPLGRNAER